MTIIPIDAGSFLCDGGGIFGGVPKILWSRQVKADDRNLIRLAMRCLLVVHDDRKVLIETGAGEKLSWKFVENNGIDNKDVLIDSLQKAGYQPEEITDVVHTHLHWDHCGGGTRFDEKKNVVPTFPNATYYCSRTQWENALNPNPRENDAYFTNDLLPVQQAGLLKLIDQKTSLFPGFDLKIFDGHTPGQIIPILTVNHQKVAYVSDLIPTIANIPLKWVAAYDLYPVTTMAEKKAFLRMAVDEQYILFFEHDTNHACATVKWDEQKGPRVDQVGALDDFINQ
jgi:glyoxylase-like metal-dependent hydrolase (beta-lactamase superfamily II)